MRTERMYHEMMSHVPILGHGRVKHVLIVGGSDLSLAAEVLRHRGVLSVVQVHADPLAVKVPRSSSDGVNAAAFGGGRFRMHIADRAEFLASTRELFDLILVDLPGHVDARSARGCLMPGGVLIASLGNPFLQPLAFDAGIKRLSAVFSNVSAYLVSVPGAAGPVAIGWGSNASCPDSPEREILAARFADARIDTRYY